MQDATLEQCNDDRCSTSVTTGRAMFAADPTKQFLAEVRRYAVAQGVPEYTKLRVCVKVADTDEEIARLLVPVPMAPSRQATNGDPGDFDPTPLQTRMIQFLAAGPKSPTQMKNYTNGHMYDSPGGINDLIVLGIVEKKFGRLRLTEIGEAIAAELGDDEPEPE